MIEQLVLGMVGTNTWLIKNKESNELLIIDPADESARIEEKIDRMGGRPVAVLLTHGHFDHMLAADDLRDEYGIPIIAFGKLSSMTRYCGFSALTNGAI